MLRSVGAILAGFAGWSVLWLVGNIGIAAVRPESFDENGLTTDAGILVGILGYSVVLSVISGWLTARIAAKSGTGHALATGVLLLLVGIGVQASVWNDMPLWYHLPFLIAILPANLVGARFAGSTNAVPSPESAAK